MTSTPERDKWGHVIRYISPEELTLLVLCAPAIIHETDGRIKYAYTVRPDAAVWSAGMLYYGDHEEIFLKNEAYLWTRLILKNKVEKENA